MNLIILLQLIANLLVCVSSNNVYYTNTTVVGYTYKQYSESYCCVYEEECTRQCYTQSDGKQKCYNTCYPICSETCYYYVYDIFSLNDYVNQSDFNKQCKFKIYSKTVDQETSMKKAKSKYPINSTVELFVNQITNNCYSGSVKCKNLSLCVAFIMLILMANLGI